MRYKCRRCFSRAATFTAAVKTDARLGNVLSENITAHSTLLRSSPRDEYLITIMAFSASSRGGGHDDIAMAASTFSRLPVEIKQQVYRFTIVTDGSFHVPERGIISDYAHDSKGNYQRLTGIKDVSASLGHARSSYRLPPVCFINKLEHTIAVNVFLRLTTIFVLCTQDGARMVLRLFNLACLTGIENVGEYLAAIRKAELNYIGRSPTTGYWDAEDRAFLAQCTQLRTLTITIPVEHLRFEEITLPAHSSQYHALELHKVIAKLKLGPLMHHAPLRRIVFRLRARHDLQDSLRRYGALILEVAKRLDQSFRERHDKGLEVWVVMENESRRAHHATRLGTSGRDLPISSNRGRGQG